MRCTGPLHGWCCSRSALVDIHCDQCCSVHDTSCSQKHTFTRGRGSICTAHALCYAKRSSCSKCFVTNRLVTASSCVEHSRPATSGTCPNAAAATDIRGVRPEFDVGAQPTLTQPPTALAVLQKTLAHVSLKTVSAANLAAYKQPTQFRDH